MAQMMNLNSTSDTASGYCEHNNGMSGTAALAQGADTVVPDGGPQRNAAERVAPIDARTSATANSWWPQRHGSTEYDGATETGRLDSSQSLPAAQLLQAKTDTVLAAEQSDAAYSAGQEAGAVYPPADIRGCVTPVVDLTVAPVVDPGTVRDDLAAPAVPNWEQVSDTVLGDASTGTTGTTGAARPMRFAMLYPLLRAGKVRRTSDGRLVQAYIALRMTPCFMQGCSTLIPPGSLLTLRGRGLRVGDGSKRRLSGPGSNPPAPCCWHCVSFEFPRHVARAQVAFLVEGTPLGSVQVTTRLRGR